MTEPLEIRAPSEESEGTRSQVLRWLKQVGDAVEVNEPLLELETDKVTVEISAPASGVLQKILLVAGEEVAPGDLLGEIGPALPPAQQPASAAIDTGTGGGRVDGNGRHRDGDNAATRDAGRDAAAAARAAPPRHASGAQSAAPPLSPAVRRLLREHGLDASDVRGSGQDGRITVQDVLSRAAAGSLDPERRGGDAQPTAHAESSSAEGATRVVPHSAVRKRTAAHMAMSLRSAPHVTTVFEADLTRVLAHRDRYREACERAGAPLTLTAYFLKAATAAIQSVPEANSRWTEDALAMFAGTHIGVATAVEGVGLMVPVIRDVGSRDLLDLARDLHDKTTRARAGRLRPEDVRGATFTISNHGVSGSLLAAPIIIPQSQAAILGIGKLERRPVVLELAGEERIVVRARCYVTLTIDHRVMDGHQANRFMRTFVGALEDWPATEQPG